MPSLCFITFNENPAGVYYPGQIISGKVNLTTDQIKAIRGIYITIKGYAEVRWTESTSTTDSNGNTNTSTTWYHARDDYFNSRIDVLRGSDADRFDLIPGRNEYNYQIALPAQLPSSFHGEYGTVKYEVVCTIDRPWKFDNVFKHPFTIISPVDLNLSPMYTQPVNRQNVKTFSRICCCGNGGEIFVTGNIPCGGFVPGQSIPVTAFVKNRSEISCSETNTCLIQMVEYRSYSPMRKSKYEIKPVTLNLFGPLERNQEKQLNCNLYIPAVAPTSFNSCNIIEVSYFVEIQLKTRGLHTNMEVRLPVTIGTIPYHYNENSMLQNISRSSFGSTTPDAPPTYEEAAKLGPIFASNADEDKYIQRIDFFPRYPVYNYTGSPTCPPNENTFVVTTQPTETGKPNGQK